MDVAHGNIESVMLDRLDVTDAAGGQIDGPGG